MGKRAAGGPRVPFEMKCRDGLETGIFKVLGARLIKSDDTIRAYAVGPNGPAVLYAKDAAAWTIAAFVGRLVQIEYRRTEDGLFAVKARPA